MSDKQLQQRFDINHPAQWRGVVLCILILLVSLFAIPVQANFMLPSTVLSASSRYSVTIKPEGSTIPIGAVHRWLISIEDRENGQKIKPIGLRIDGGMPAHGHGLPTAPKASEYDETRGWLIDGVKFNMAGLWQLTVKFQTNEIWDTATVKIAVGKRVTLMSHATTDTWSAAEKAVLATLRLRKPSQVALHTGNELAARLQTPDAISAGKSLFFDANLSRSGSIACATCHQPELNFTDGLAKAIGLEPLERNAPTLLGSASSPWQYWDGRRDSLWSQALVPMEAPAEMGNNRTRISRYITSEYRSIYEKIFGAVPQLPDNLPVDAGPSGTDSEKHTWDQLSPDVRKKITEIFINTGKMIAAWEATLTHEPTRFDLFVELLTKGDSKAANEVLDASERAGAKLFINNKAQCMNCHNSPLFTNFGFHNIGTGVDDEGKMDFGRLLGSQAVQMNEFNCRSQFNGESSDCAELEFLGSEGHGHSTRGAFKVPTLRGLSKTAPYMHDGRFATLEEVMDFYVDPPAITGTMQHELPALNTLTDADVKNLVAFIKTL